MRVVKPRQSFPRKVFGIFLRKIPTSNHKTGFDLPPGARTQHIPWIPWIYRMVPSVERGKILKRNQLWFSLDWESLWNSRRSIQEVIKPWHLSKETQSQIPWKPCCFWVLAMFDPTWNHHKSWNFALFISPEGWESRKSNDFPAPCPTWLPPSP